MAGAKAAFSVLFLLALVVMAVPPGVGAEASRPSYVNNHFYLHYNMTRKEGWMNTNPNETDDTGWHNVYGLFQETQCNLGFPLKPYLDNNNSMNVCATRAWAIGICLLSDKPGEVTGALVIDGVYSCSKNLVADGNGWFFMEYDVGLGFIDYRWNLTFNISFMMHRGDFIAPYYELLTHGDSNMTIPILATEPDTDNDGLPDSMDPDDDNDGHNDKNDAYPLDPTKWKQPEPTKGFVPGFDVLLAFVALAVSISVVFRKRSCL